MTSKLRGSLKRLAHAADDAFPWAAIHAGNRFECPCCGGRFARLRSFAGRPNARCPRCGSLERHRVLWLYLAQRTELLEQDLDVLHFAAELPFESRFRAMANWRYVSADLYPKGSQQVRVDITAIDIPDDSFDLVVCNHVLPEVPDDRAGMHELARVTKPGGLLVTQTPIDGSRATTSSEPAGAGSTRGERLGGSELRIYGLDYADLLARVGFEVERVDYVDEVGADVAARHALTEVGAKYRGNEIYLATKPPA